jgi:hypothetical protein
MQINKNLFEKKKETGRLICVFFLSSMSFMNLLVDELDQDLLQQLRNQLPKIVLKL